MLRQWSFAKVALLSAGWVAVCVVAAVAWVLVPAWLEFSAPAGAAVVAWEPSHPASASSCSRFHLGRPFSWSPPGCWRGGGSAVLGSM